jgi:hypothetical protein
MIGFSKDGFFSGGMVLLFWGLSIDDPWRQLIGLLLVIISIFPSIIGIFR